MSDVPDALTFDCTTPGCAETVELPVSATRDEFFDPAFVICDECHWNQLPDDCKYLRAATAEEVAAWRALPGIDRIDLSLSERERKARDAA